MLNRKKTEPLAESTVKDSGKGRPTPTRKEAEAAAKQRAKTVIDAKGRAKQQRMSNAARVRDAMRTGDDRYLPARDQGPVKRFVRDWIDSRVSIIEFILPILVLIMVLSYSGNTKAQSYGVGLELAVFLLVIIEGGWVVVGSKRAVRRKFPNESTRGLTSYALLRAMNMRFLRMPKTQVGPGGKPKKRR